MGSSRRPVERVTGPEIADFGADAIANVPYAGAYIAMIALNQTNALLSQLTQASALIGKDVAWVDLETEQPGSGTVESVKVVDGLAVLRIDGQDVPLAAITEVLGETSTTPES